MRPCPIESLLGGRERPQCQPGIDGVAPSALSTVGISSLAPRRPLTRCRACGCPKRGRGRATWGFAGKSSGCRLPRSNDATVPYSGTTAWKRQCRHGRGLVAKDLLRTPRRSFGHPQRDRPRCRVRRGALRHRDTTVRSGDTSAPPTRPRPAGIGSPQTRETQTGDGDDESPGHATTGTRSVNATVPTTYACHPATRQTTRMRRTV